ncbi:MAG: PAS domain-containing protein [Chitinispirillaceae bacterium]|nr:PAS domain-containing protein [Chitinispirillaceae bacterium]
MAKTINCCPVITFHVYYYNMDTILPLYVLSGLFLATASALSIAVVRLSRARKKESGSSYRFHKRTGTESKTPELQAVFDSITDDICIIDQGFRIQNANARYMQSVKRSLSAVRGSKCHEMYFHQQAPCDLCAAAETFSTGEPVVRKKIALRRGDDAKNLEVSFYPIFDAGKKVVNVIEYIRDMTDETQMLEQLIRSEKLAGIGVMTTGIAHEMNNALSGIAGTASNLLTMPEKFELSDKAINRIFSILDAATRATSVMKNLLQFSHPLREETRIMVNVKNVLKKIVTGVYIQEAPDIERRMNFDELLPPIKADHSKIELVLMNVVSNAIRSIQEKKSRSAKEGTAYKGLLIVSARLQHDMVLVTVTDNGVGIPENIRSKIFDPFFSTWPISKGTGLGLSTALHIVEEHGGRIFFESIDDLTTFSILLPINRRRTIDFTAHKKDNGTGRFQQ